MDSMVFVGINGSGHFGLLTDWIVYANDTGWVHIGFIYMVNVFGIPTLPGADQGGVLGVYALRPGLVPQWHQQ